MSFRKLQALIHPLNQQRPLRRPMKHLELTSPLGLEEVEHTADLAYRVWGESLEELFTCADHSSNVRAGDWNGSLEMLIVHPVLHKFLKPLY